MRRAGSSVAGQAGDLGHGDLRSRSRVILDGPDRAQARAYLKGIGFDDDALQRPIVGIANTWTETMPCNFHLRRLAERVKVGVRAAGGTPMEFNTVAISDGITMGTAGMKTSLVSREVIADSIELVARGHLFDALIAMVLNSMGVPPAARMPSFTLADKRRRWKLQGMVSVQVLATPTRGRSRASAS